MKRRCAAPLTSLPFPSPDHIITQEHAANAQTHPAPRRPLQSLRHQSLGRPTARARRPHGQRYPCPPPSSSTPANKRITGCTAKAVTHRLAKFRKQAGAFNGGKQGGEKAAAAAGGAGGGDGDDDEEAPSPKKKAAAAKKTAVKKVAGGGRGKKRKVEDVEGEESEDAKVKVKGEEGEEGEEDF